MAARDNEKMWWFRKDKNYYNNHKLKALHKRKNGYAYSILLEHIKCESTPYKGILKFSETRAYTIEELAAVADMSVKMVKNGLEALKELELISIDVSGVITVNEFADKTGSLTEGAKRKREYREQKNEGQIGDKLGTNWGQTSLESRVKSKDIKEYILKYLSSSKIKFTELGMDKEYNQVKMMMIKAAQITNILPKEDRVISILNEVIFNENLCNKQGYLINCFRHEVSEL